MNDESGTALRRFEISVGPYASGELDVRSFKGREEVSRPFSFEVVVATTVDAEALEDELLGAVARFTINLPDHGVRVIEGVVTELRAREDLLPHVRHQCRLRIEPRLSLAALRRDTRIFQNLTVTEIIDAVLREHHVECEWRLDARYPARTYCVQYEESDLAFVQRLLAEEGIFYVFAPPSDDGRERIVCLDVAEGYEAIEGDPTLIYQEAEGMVGGSEHVHRFKLERRVRSGSVALHDFDFERPSLDLSAKDRLEAPAKRVDERALEVYEHHGEHHDPDVRRTLVRGMLGGLRADATLATGRSGCRRLAPGKTFTLVEHEVARLNQRYAVTALTHEGHCGEAAEREERGSKELALRPTYENRFECVPAEVAYRPARGERRRAQVVETATVVGPAGEEIYVDPLGRIKVQFHWDRHGKNDESSSCWIRVAQAWAGAGWGFQFIPRIGMEVLVTFLGGDLDRPMVTGCVFNGEHPLPYALPGQKTRSGIRTSSTPGNDGSNELRFDDAKGREQVYVHAERDYDQVVENNRSDVTHGHETRVVDKNRSRTVRGHETVAIGHSQKVSVDGDHVRTVKGNEVVTVHRNLVMHILGHQVIHIDGNAAEGTADDDAADGATAAAAASKLAAAAAGHATGGTGARGGGAGDVDEVDSTRIPTSEVLSRMMAMPKMTEALNAIAEEPRVAEALAGLAGHSKLVEVLTTVAGEPKVQEAMKVIGSKTTAALLLRGRSLVRGKSDPAQLVAELRPDSVDIPESVVRDVTEAAKRGVVRGGGGAINAFSRDFKDPKHSSMTINGKGDIDASEGFKISAGGSFIEVTPAGITIKGPIVTIDGHPIKLNC